MECAFHPGVAAAGTCSSCGKGLCSSCVNRFVPPLCESCLISQNDNVSRRLIKDIIMTIIVFGIVLLFAKDFASNFIYAIGIAGLAACAYWGWQFLGSLSSFDLWVLGGRDAFIFYLIFKLILAILIGIFVTPWQIYKRFKIIADVKKLKQDIQNGKS